MVDEDAGLQHQAQRDRDDQSWSGVLIAVGIAERAFGHGEVYDLSIARRSTLRSAKDQANDGGPRGEGC
jgi:hypothetical protein